MTVAATAFTFGFAAHYAMAESKEQVDPDQAAFSQEKEKVDRHRGAETHSSMAEEPLIGKWIINVEKTYNFHAKNYKKMPLWVDMSACSLRSVELAFDEKSMELSYSPDACKRGDVPSAREGWKTNFQYLIIFSSEKQTVLKIDGEPGVFARVANWTSVSEFWVDEVSDAEVMRYYFKRK